MIHSYVLDVLFDVQICVQLFGWLSWSVIIEENFVFDNEIFGDEEDK